MASTLQRALVLSHGDDAATTAVVRTLEGDGWTVVLTDRRAADSVPALPLHGVVYIPGLLGGVVPPQSDAVTEFLELVDAVQPHLPTAADGGARVVAVGCRDWLGWPTRAQVAAQSAGLIAAVRSLALAHGRAGVTVNAVVGMPPDADRSAEPAPGTRLYEPVPLTGQPVGAEDVAAAVAFFLHPRSDYITGQVLHCCGGASLLSSMSV